MRGGRWWGVIFVCIRQICRAGSPVSVGRPGAKGPDREQCLNDRLRVDLPLHTPPWRRNFMLCSIITNCSGPRLQPPAGPSSGFTASIASQSRHARSPRPTVAMASQDSDPVAACPVHHKAQEAWLKQSGAQTAGQPHAPPHGPLQSSSGCDSSQMDSTPASASAPSTATVLGSTALGTRREVSTIPRAIGQGPAAATKEGRPANNEKDTGADNKTGNWIYPSEKMFFDAMKRKAYNPERADMKTIVPIHNAVNERAWMEIKEWEKGRGAEAYARHLPVTGCYQREVLNSTVATVRALPPSPAFHPRSHRAPASTPCWATSRLSTAMIG